MAKLAISMDQNRENKGPFTKEYVYCDGMHYECKT